MLNSNVRRTSLILGLGLILILSITVFIYDWTRRDNARIVNDIVLSTHPDSDQRIHAGAGDDVVYGRGGQDEIRGDEGDDTLYGNEGDDLLTGGTGNDTYGYARGDGNDTIIEIIEDGGSADKLLFSNINPGSIDLRQKGEDLIIAITESAAGVGDSGSIFVESGRAGAQRGIESITFSNGTIWSPQDISTHISVIEPEGIVGTAGENMIDGTMDDDLIVGLEGNDSLAGSFGDDVYVYASGQGSDVIDDGVNMSNEIDALRLTDLATLDVTLSRASKALRVTIRKTGEAITIQKQFLPDGYWGIEKIEFSDGISWNRDKILESTAD
ncbi:calcium-binding protein [Rhizobium gallicum]|uniref:calcium-binding protein n=1 Tax=Rhizobium gallicum TaxID=56730 RepID=UPI001EF7EDFF|nr:calcium-binding protein [Rhizobium gallicum]ULJ74485.1 calcium-binding protein [Rhizobium gallicum]